MHARIRNQLGIVSRWVLLKIARPRKAEPFGVFQQSQGHGGQKLLGHIDEHQRYEDLIGAKLHLQDARDQRPQASAQGPGQHHQRKDEHAVQGIECQARTGAANGPDDILPLGPDVPDARPESQRQSDGDQNQWRALDQQLRAIKEREFAKKRLPENRDDRIDRVFAQYGKKNAAKDHGEQHGQHRGRIGHHGRGLRTRFKSHHGRGPLLLCSEKILPEGPACQKRLVHQGCRRRNRRALNAEHVDDAQNHDHGRSHEEGPKHGRLAAVQTLFLGVAKIHEKDDAQVVIGPDHGRDHTGHGQPGEAPFIGRAQHIELAEKAQHRRHAGQRKQKHQHGQRLARFPLCVHVQRRDFDDGLAVLLHHQDECERAYIHRHIDRHIDQHRLHAQHGARRQPHQRIAHMGNGRERHEALDVGLTDGRKGPKEHRQDRQQRHDLLPVRHRIAKGVMHHAGKERHGRNFGRCGKEGRDRRGRTFIDVRRPHVEGHGRNLEGKARHQEHEAKQEAQRHVVLRHLHNAREQRRARIAIDQRRAIEQKARRQRAQHKVFQARFGRFDAVPAQRGHDIQSQRLQLQPHIKRHQVARRHHHHHAHSAQRHQHRVFKPQKAARLHIPFAHQQHSRRRQQDHNLGEAREPVIHEHAVECDIGPLARDTNPGRKRDKHRRCRPKQDRGQTVLGRVHRAQQAQHGKDRQQDFRQDDCQISSHNSGS
mmetsp:Transcript_18462/g.30078  ORF Transcript_18462/g.30078 Transcript_18462/m.30078 type:complete len:709 (-) Transcript_18462:9727-11853(-)